MRHLLLPAIIARWLDHRNDRPANWFDPDPEYAHFYRPQALLSRAVWEGRTVSPDIHKATREGFVLGDSGGFSIVSRGASMDPVDVIRWQIRNCTVGVILDVPPYRISGRAYKADGDSWNDSLKRTLSNVRLASEVYDHSAGDFRWWGVVQGENTKQMEAWYNAVSEVYPFDLPGEGWAIKPTPANNFYSMARSVRFIQEHEIKRAHLLMTTGIKTVAALLSMLYLTGEIELVTYDSASAGIYTGNRHAWWPNENGLTLREWLPRVYLPKDYAAMPCTCPPCLWFKEEFETDPDLPEQLFIDRLALHNHLMLFTFFDRIGEEAKADPERLLRRYTKGQYGDVMRALEGGETKINSAHRAVSLIDRV